LSYRGECVAGVRDKHASLSHSSITNCDTLNEPCCAHLSAMLHLPLPPFHPFKLLCLSFTLNLNQNKRVNLNFEKKWRGE